MDIRRLPLNEYALVQIRYLEQLAGIDRGLGAHFADELGKPPRATYLGAFNDEQELVGVARLITATGSVVLVDMLEVRWGSNEYEDIETLLLDAANELAAESGKTLAVIADADNAPQWNELGFQKQKQSLLTFSQPEFEY